MKKIILGLALSLTIVAGTPVKAGCIEREVVVGMSSKTVTFNKEDIRGSAKVTSEALRKVVPETMKEIVNDIVYFSEVYGVNALAITGIIRQESGNNTSRLANSKNNLGGIKFSTGEYRTFKSKTECIEYMVKLLKNNYLSPDGKYFNGYSLRDINKLYCPDDGYFWSKQVSIMATKMMNDIKKLK